MIDYRSELEAHSEPELAEFNSRLTPGKEGILGVRVPVIRSIAKAIVKDDWRSFLSDEPACFEEEMLRGIVIATAPVTAEERVSMTEGFLPYVDNWATCDVFCSSWKFKKHESDLVWDYFAGLIDTDDEFRMRVSVIARMSHFKDEDHSSMLLEDLATHDHEGYYYRMGSAWAVSMVYVRFPEMTRGLLESHRLEPWTHNKSIQKIRESYRVSKDEKEYVRGLRVRRPHRGP